MTRSFIAAILRYRVVVLGVAMVVSGLALYGARNVTFDSSIEIWFLEDDESLAAYREFQDTFGSDEAAVMGVFAGDVLSPDSLAAIDAMTRAVEALPQVRRVRSVTTIFVVQLLEEDTLDVARLVEELPRTAADSEAIRAIARASKQLDGMLAPDDSAAAIVVELEPDSRDFDSKAELVAAMRKIAAEHGGATEVVLTGPPVFDHVFYKRTERDFGILGPAALLLIFAVMMVVFRRLSAALVPLIVVIVAILWTFGIMGALGLKINAVSSTLVSVILAIGIADAIHLVTEFYEQLGRDKSVDDALTEAFVNLLTPCFFTTVTTMVGLLSLVVSEIGPIREFGVLAALGVGLAFITSMVLGPVLLQWARKPKRWQLDRIAESRIAGVLRWLARHGRRRSVSVATVAGVVVIASGLAMFGLEVGVNPVKYFRESDPMRVDTLRVERALGGTATLEIRVRAADEGLKDPDRLRVLDQLQEFSKAQTGVTSTLSVLDSLKETNRMFRGGDDEQYAVPESQDLAAQYYLILESDPDLDRLMQGYDLGRITLRTKMSGEIDRPIDVMSAIEDRARALSGDDLELTMTGYVALMSSMYDYLLDSQIDSLLLALVVITLMLCVLLRSLRLGLFALIPNLTPIIIGLGVMAAVGIHLDVGTVMIGSVALGIVVDDTVHFLVRLRRQADAGRDLDDAIASTISGGGRAIVTTSLTLAAGFGILMLGSFLANVYFGLITSLIIVLAMVADLVVLPAALRLIRPRL